MRDKSFDVIPLPDYDCSKSGVGQVSNSFSKIVDREDPLAYKWKKGKEESSETVKEIERKGKQVAIPYNKGGYMYILPENVKSIGRK